MRSFSLWRSVLVVVFSATTLVKLARGRCRRRVAFAPLLEALPRAIHVHSFGGGEGTLRRAAGAAAQRSGQRTARVMPIAAAATLPIRFLAKKNTRKNRINERRGRRKHEECQKKQCDVLRAPTYLLHLPTALGAPRAFQAETLQVDATAIHLARRRHVDTQRR